VNFDHTGKAKKLEKRKLVTKQQNCLKLPGSNVLEVKTIVIYCFEVEQRFSAD
jgi:hypothetical protein